MKLIKPNETHTYKDGNFFKAMEYNFENPNLGFAVTVTTGRYPQKGYLVNKEVEEMIYVLEGTATLTFKNGNVFLLSKDDVILLNKNEPCFWETDYCKLAVTCSPEWNKNQHKNTD